MRLESPNIADYLRATEVVDWTHPAVRAKAEELARGAADDTARARILFEWVRDEIPPTKDIDADVVAAVAEPREGLTDRIGIFEEIRDDDEERPVSDVAEDLLAHLHEIR